MTRAVITGGGTSGHVLPARAIIESLQDAGVAVDDLKYVGSRRGVESTMMADMEAAGVECAYLPISGLRRSFSPRAIMSNVALLWRLPVASFLARRLVARWCPNVVVSVGGYASEPMSRAAIAAGVPLVCVSYDRIPGLATRRQSAKAAVCAVAFADSPLPRAVHTGAPVRREIIALDVASARVEARLRLGIPQDAIVVSVTGGSLGSQSLNDMVPLLARELAAVQGGIFAVYHVCGSRNAESAPPSIPSTVWYRRVGYESDMAGLYAATDVLVARAGASTIAEIATVGLASVLVPWPGSADNHQEMNARWLGDVGASVVLDDGSIQSVESISRIVRLAVDSTERSAIATAAREMGSVHRDGSLARVIIAAGR